MKKLNLSVYKEYIDHVKKYGINSSGAQDNAFKMLADLTETPSIYSSHMERDDDQPYPEEERARVQNFLKSLRVNGKELFSGGDAVDDSNYREKLTDAMAVIAIQMQDPKATQVPYVQKEDGHCDAIIPEFPVISSPTKPEKPAWYKRFFQSLIPSWRQEVQQYKEKVEKFNKENSSYRESQEFVEFAKKLEERAHKRELQTAALKAEKNREICNQEIDAFFGKTPEEIVTSYKVTKNHILKNVGRQNVPVGFAIGMMMAQENMTFDQARDQTVEKKKEYGEKFDQFFKKATEIGNMPEEKKEDQEKKMRRFKEELVPVFIDVMNVYATESIRPVDKNSADSIAKDGLRNNMFYTYCQGVAQMINDTMSMYDPSRQLYAIAMGEEIRKRAEALKGKEDLLPREEALIEFAKAPVSDVALHDITLNRTGNLEKRDVVNVYSYALDSLKACAMDKKLSDIECCQGLFNSTIEGSRLELEDEIEFERRNFMTIQRIGQGLASMPDFVKKQYYQPLYRNASARIDIYNTYQDRFGAPSPYNEMTSEKMNQYRECVERGVKFPGQEDKFDEPEKQKKVRELEEFIKNSLRRQTSVALISENQAAKSGKQAAAPTNQVAAPAEQATAPVEQATAPAEQATAPAEQATAPVEQATAPTAQAATPTAQAANSTNQAAKPPKDLSPQTQEKKSLKPVKRSRRR